MAEPGLPLCTGPKVLGSGITLTPADMAEISRLCQTALLKLIQLDEIRFFIMTRRWNEFLARGGKIVTKQPDSSDVVANTIEHNMRQLGTNNAFGRPLGLLGPLLGIDEVAFDRARLRVLIIGPRTENELLLYFSHGFPMENLRGLDLISYSPWVDIGDMHAMPYPNRAFDIVVFSWVLGYSANQKKAVAEAIRVCKPGGLVAIGEEFEPRSQQQLDADLQRTKGYTLHGTVTKHADHLVALFGDAVDHVVFRTEPRAQQRDRVGWVTVIVRLKDG